MILAAGLGTRLRPLSDTIPKVLVPVLGTPFLERLLAYLTRQGVRQLAMNTHHLASTVESHLMESHLAAHPDGKPLPAPFPLRLFHEPTLLGTGGGLRNAADFWGDETLLVWNGDIVCSFGLEDLEAAHGPSTGPPPQGKSSQSKASAAPLATLVVQARESGSYLLVDEADRVCGIDSARRGVRRLERQPQGNARPMAFNGVSLLSPRLLARMKQGTDRLGRPGEQPGQTPGEAFDLIDVLLEAIAEGEEVRAWDAGAAFYGTTGSPERLRDLEAGLKARPDVLKAWTPGMEGRTRLSGPGS